MHIGLISKIITSLYLENVFEFFKLILPRLVLYPKLLLLALLVMIL